MLPHQHMQAAMNLLLALTPEVLTLPRLARRTIYESDLRQHVAGFPGLIEGPGDRLYIDRETAEAELDTLALAFLRNDTLVNPPPVEQQLQLGDFGRGVAGAPRAKAIMVELLGPVSTALMLTDGQERPLLYAPELRETIAQHISLRAGWYATQLKAYSQDVVLCLDEPMLGALDSPFSPVERDEGLGLIAQVLQSIPRPRGLVIGGLANWDGLINLPLDVIVCEAYEEQFSLVESASTVKIFIERGGVLALGVVPSDQVLLEEERVADCVARVQHLLAALAERGLAKEQLIKAMLITTSGGLAHGTPGMAEQALQLCAYTTEQLRGLYL
jgi:hypothetical protein